MIRLTRLDGEAFLLNAELIKYVEARPDTFITLTTGDRLVVGQSLEDVMRLTLEYQQSKALVPSIGAAGSSRYTASNELNHG